MYVISYMGAQAFVPPSLRSTEKLSPASAPSKKRGADAGAFALFSASAFLLLALASLSLDPDDPSFHGGDWMGQVGAAFAGAFARGFGGAAWLAPLALISFGLPWLRGQRPQLVGFRF
ncbi:MAG: DNA translocase FtsK 4TM domain-containing protein, partial [Polyangiaceae bacterium]|nr:DNA translocase FtsK 4TM domain-containing protein [Polyangiaceae bacterium]